ncbi:MAG: AsmA-like C-terminal domain-containing protein [Desulfococcaceae bacterium]
MTRFLGRCARWTLILLTVSAILGIAGWVGLRIFSPKLAMLYPAIQEAVDRAAPDWDATFGEVEIDWINRWFVPGVSVTDVTLGRENQPPALALPRVLLVFDLGDLIQGQISPAALEVDSPRLILSRLGRTPDAPGPPAEPTETQTSPPLPDRLRKLAETLALDIPLRKIQVLDLQILPTPEAENGPAFPEINGQIHREPERVRLTLEAETDTGKQAGKVEADLRLPRTGRAPAEAKLSLEDWTPDRFSHLHPRLAPLAGLKIPVAGTFRLALSPEGRFSLPEIQLTARGGRIERPELFPEPLKPVEIQWKATVTPGLERMEIQEAVADFGGPVFRLSGRVGPFPDPRNWNIEAGLDAFAVDDLARFWPKPFLPDTRGWLARNLSDGTVDGATFAFQLTPETFQEKPIPAEAVSATVPFSGLTLTYLSSMEAVRNIAGAGQFSARSLDFTLTDGDHYESTLSDAEVAIGPLGLADPVKIDVKADVSGPADAIRRAAADLFRREDTGFTLTSGRAKSRLRLNFPLNEKLKEEFRWSTDIRLENLATEDLGNFAVKLNQLDAQLTESGRLKVDGRDGEIARPGFFAEPVPVSRLGGNAQLLRRTEPAIPMEFEAEAAGTQFTAQGKINPAADPFTLDANVQIERLDLDTALRYWPEPVAAPVRNWIAEHLEGGVFTNANLRIDLEAAHQDSRRLPLTSVEAELPFQGIRLVGLPAAAPLESLAGTARFTARGVRIDVTSGAIGQTRLESGTVDISGLGAETGPVLQVDAHLIGPAHPLRQKVANAMKTDLETIPPLEPPDLPTRTRVQFTLPFDRAAQPDPPRLTVSADPSAPVRLGALPISRAEASFRFEPDGIRLGGHFVSQGLRVDLEPAPLESVGTEGCVLTADLTDAQLSQLGPRTMIQATGRAPTRLRVRPEKAGLAFDLESDLQPATLSFPPVGWRKPAGEAGTLKAAGALDRNAGRLRISRLELSGPDFETAGSLDWSLKDGLQSLSLDPLRLPPQRLTLSVSPDSAGFNVRVAGERLDLGPILEGRGKRDPSAGPGQKKDTTKDERKEAASGDSASGEKADQTPPKAALNLDVSRVRLAKNAELRDLTGEVRLKGGRVSKADLEARQGKENPLTVKVTEDGTVSLRAGDAGSLLRGFQLSEHIKGGSLEVSATFSEDGGFRPPVNGRIILRNPTILNAPGLVRLLSAASLVGLLNELKDGGMGFSVVETGFQYRGDVVAISDGRAEGFAMGLTADGAFNLSAKTVDLKGLAVPFNVLNKVLGAIPLVGKLVGKGIIAVNYQMTGPLEDPNVQVEPLSTLPIGAIRQVFQNPDLRSPENSASD